MKVVIIGGQASGMTFAMQLQRNNSNVEIYLIEASSYISFGACGLPYYIGDFFKNENYLFAKQVSDITNSNIKIYTKHQALNVNHLTKQVSLKNLENNEIFNLDFDKLLIATGSIPNIPSFVNSTNNQKIYTLKSLTDAKKIKEAIPLAKSIGIIGAGYIGLELLESLENKNINITLLDSKDLLTDGLLDKDFEEILLNEINKKNNIQLHLKTNISNIIENKNNVIVKAHNKEYIFDFIILATGFKPNIDFLSNIPFSKLPNGALIIDNNGQTNIPNIYASGDCASIYHKVLQKNSYIPLATIANKMARKIADSINNISNSFNGTLGSSCLKMLNLEIAKTGICEFEAIQNDISYTSIFVEDYNHTNYYPNQEKIYVKLLFNQHKEIIGAQIAGKNGAMLRINSLSVAIEKKLTIDELSMLDFAYAPPFSRTWDILNTVGNLAIKKANKN